MAWPDILPTMTMDPRQTPYPPDYAACRALFRRAVERAGAVAHGHPIPAAGPNGQTLTIESAAFGAHRPRRALLVLSGVHGVEGFIGSALQCDLVSRLPAGMLPGDVGVLFLHAVNPWGMAWGRRQNESNVDLNRNWQRHAGVPFHNPDYALVHPLVCPDGADRPVIDAVFAAVNALVRERGAAWVRDAITAGQYSHATGLHYGGARTEASTAIVEAWVAAQLEGIECLLTIDLHTGHGPRGALTLLCDQPPGSAQHRFLAGLVGDAAVEATTGNAAATTAMKAGQIANGLARLFPAATCHATSAEFGTVSDGRQLAMTVLEQWAYRHGRRDDPGCRDIVEGYRACFTPDDGNWAAGCMAQGRALLDAALHAVRTWSES
jgi:predicted deacylase